MLQYRAVYPETLELLNKLMLLSELQNFFLVGGTALALQLGHRISVDLDLFTLNDFNTKNIFEKLNSQFEIVNSNEASNTLNFDIVFPEKSENIVKIDLIKYPYPLIKPILKIDNIRLLSILDIIPMKLSAVAGRGSKKDFYDIFYLLKIYSLGTMFELFNEKFPNTNEFQILKSLTYFNDAEIEPSPQMIERVEWDIVKSKIKDETNKYIKNN